MPSTRLVLASASPARRRLLEAAGVDPEVEVSGVDEDGFDERDAETMVATLARRKAEAVARRRIDGLVLGADSTLELDGVAHGKPHTAQAAAARWRAMRGRAGVLVTGHHLVDAATGTAAWGVARTVVRFGDPDDGEVAAYVATGEPLEVAGAFTLDGYGAAFVESVDGDPSNVIGLSLPLVRRLVRQLGRSWSDLWR